MSRMRVLAYALACLAATATLGAEPASQTALDAKDGRQGRYDTPPRVLETATDAKPRNANPAKRRHVSWPKLVSRGEFTSVQVNVDEFGNNIVADAANEPSIAIDPADPNRIVIGWRQFDDIDSDFRQAGWAYSHDAGETWVFSGSLTPGVFGSDPVLEVDTHGVFYYLSINFEEMRLFKSFNGGATWDDPIVLAREFRDKPWMVIDRHSDRPEDPIYVTWTGTPNYARSFDGGLTFELGELPLPTWGTMAVATDGTLYFAGVDDLAVSHVVAGSTTANDPSGDMELDWINAVDLGGASRAFAGPNPRGLLGQVWIAVGPLGDLGPDLYVVGSVGPPDTDSTDSDPLDVMFVRSADGGHTWTTPVRINTDSEENGAWQWFATMSVAPNGRIDVVWNDTRNGNGALNQSEVFYSYSSDAGATWSQDIAVTPSFDSYQGWPSQNKIGDYYHMISDNGGANLAYAATFNGEQDIYFLRIAPDCNENDVHDQADISNGTSTDCNKNRIPDDCENERDTDRDGPCDSSDNCPTVPNPEQQDADADGVGDACDQCPLDSDKTDAGACGVADTDSDKDEVPDCSDYCPDTTPDAEVRADGCESSLHRLAQQGLCGQGMLYVCFTGPFLLVLRRRGRSIASAVGWSRTA